MKNIACVQTPPFPSVKIGEGARSPFFTEGSGGGGGGVHRYEKYDPWGIYWSLAQRGRGGEEENRRTFFIFLFRATRLPMFSKRRKRKIQQRLRRRFWAPASTGSKTFTLSDKRNPKLLKDATSSSCNQMSPSKCTAFSTISVRRKQKSGFVLASVSLRARKITIPCFLCVKE